MADCPGVDLKRVVIPNSPQHFLRQRRRLVQHGVGALILMSTVPMAMGQTERRFEYEQEVVESVRAIEQSDLSGSLSNLESLLEKYPNSKLGYLLMGDLLAARAGDPGLISRFDDNSRQLNGLRDELSHRWSRAHDLTPAARGMIPVNLIQSSPTQQYVLVADASHSRLYVFENMGTSYRLVEDYFMTIGKEGMVKNVEGDLRTPEGVYFVTNYLPGEELPPRYGPGAFPINYPNEYDRQLRRTGYGIWIHGTEPENINRVPLASDGCLSLSNQEFDLIRKYISTDGSTPVIISRQFQWIDPSNREALKASAQSLLTQWESDWESLDTERYLRHYSSDDFRGYKRFAENKKRVNRYKKYIDVELSNLSIYGYPGDEQMLLVTFDQDYRSDNHHSVTQKRQYWVNRDGRWEIINES